ncbi:Putative Ulp1 protease family catalytic domain, papain-like cysteine peptidase superfamily [Septoria linicola]|uniref:Ulp1 protease family catalytic domain, papain-like cysteine peptidase superfamily n=1 Tax=Septoria linicola TaxID=215465 RepID=A0A9Q9EJI0_9PEZI|nr:Putative Ulp1 protease family catalytic domain, papain-like cysteine peptidase superfamily [Septoria linicola]
MRSIPERLSDFAGKVQELFNGSPSEGAPSNVTSNTNDSTVQNSLVQVPSSGNTPAPIASRSGKRGRGEEEVNSGRSSKSSRRSGSANDLVRNYQRRPPSNSTPIAVPEYNPEVDWKPKQAPTMGAPHRPQGGVKPTNTLNRSSQHSIRATQPHHSSSASSGHGNAVAIAANQPRLDVSTSRGTSVAGPPAFLDPSGLQQRPLKRQKMHPTPGSDPVDLTSDDNHLDLTQGRAIPARHAATPATSQRSTGAFSDRSKKRHKHPQDIFGNDEMNTADDGLSYKYSKNTQKGLRKKGLTSSRSISPNQPRQGRTGQQIGTAQTPLLLDDDDVSTLTQRANPKKPARTEIPEVEELLSIDLGKGVEEAGDEHRRKRRKGQQGSVEDLNQVDNIMASAGYGNRRSTQTRSIFAENERRNVSQPITHTAKLRQQFVRDGGVDEVDEIEDDPIVDTERSSKAWTHKQPSSSRPQTRDQSPDALTGARTVLSRNSRSTSPAKGIPVVSRSENRPNIGTLKQKGPTSALQPNTFTKTSKPAVLQDGKSIGSMRRMNEKYEDDDEDNAPIAITSIICKGYANSSPGLNLVWHTSSRSFLLAEGTGSVVYSPFGPQPISVGRLAVSHGYKTNNRSLKVILKGTANWMSTGTILIEFANRRSKHLFDTALCDSPGMMMNEIPVETLNATFTNLGNIESQHYLNSLAQTKQKGQHNPARAMPQASEERIVYKTEQPPRAKAVSRMKGETLSEALLDEERRGTPKHHDGEISSPYFAPGQPTRRSTRQSKPSVQYREISPELEKWTAQNGTPRWAKPVVYPEQGPRRVTIDADDLKHLDAGEFLNDNILNYALRDIEEGLPTEQKHRFHFFNTFFFTSLTAKNGKKAFNYEAVMKWTKNVDLFTKEFVVVPINLDLHWFVIVIHNLPLLKRRLLDSDDEEQPAEDTVDLESDNEVVTPQSDGPQSRLEQMTLSDTAEAAMDEPILDALKLLGHDTPLAEGQMSSTKSKKGRKKKPVPPTRKFPSNQATIVSLDSFGVKRTHEAAIIKEYIIAEAAEKRSMEITKKDIQGVNASGIPQQNNFYDCGVYLIGYMKEFVRDPDRFVKRILGRELDTSDFAAFDTSALRNEVRDNLLKYGDMVSEKYKREKLAKRKAQSEVGKTPSKNLAASNDAAPASSQPSRSSPSAKHRSSRQATPSAPSVLKTPSISTKALRGSPEPPTSTTFPRASHDTHVSAEDDNDELELDVPRALQVSKSPRDHGSRVSPSADKGDIEADGEILDVPEKNSRLSVHRTTTPPRPHGPAGHNSHLSPLSSLEQDANRSAGRPAPSVSDARATVTGGDTPKEEIKEEDEIKIENEIKQEAKAEDKPTMGVKVEEQDMESDATDIKSESDEAESDQGRLTVISIPDEGEADPLAEQDPEWQGFDHGDAIRPVEIPDSQPETQQSLSLQ